MTFEDKLRDAFARAEVGLPAEPRPRWEETYMSARRSRVRHLAALAAAAVLLAAGGVAGAAWLTRGDEGGRRLPVASSPGPAPSPTPSPTPEPVPGADCSAAGLDAELPDQPGLPGPVAATRRAIAARAVLCDYEGLAALARQGGEGFSFSFGAGDDPAAYWEMLEGAGEPVLFDLVQILKASYATGDEVYPGYQGPEVYWWPRAFRHDARDADFAELVELGVIDEQELRSYREFGGYIGYRLSIRANGDWTAFIAGD